MEPLPRVFDMLQYVERILLSVESLLNKVRYILSVVVLLETCDVTKHGRQLGFYQELEIRLKLWELAIFCSCHVK